MVDTRKIYFIQRVHFNPIGAPHANVGRLKSLHSNKMADTRTLYANLFWKLEINCVAWLPSTQALLDLQRRCKLIICKFNYISIWYVRKNFKFSHMLVQSWCPYTTPCNPFKNERKTILISFFLMPQTG
jgi:hypothetical protein